MRISDWSSDVCSSDLYPAGCRGRTRRLSQPSRSGRGTYGHFGSRPKAQAPRQDKIIVILWSTAVHAMFIRSEEHTSELQSLMRISYAVFCLNKKRQTTTSIVLTTHS